MKDNFDNIEVMLEGLDENDISSILSKWKDISVVRKQLDNLEDSLKDKIKIYLKERKWNSYHDTNTDISVKISKYKKEKIDKEQLKFILSDAQQAQVIRMEAVEKMSIITPETRKRLKQYVRKNKTKSRWSKVTV